MSPLRRWPENCAAATACSDLPLPPSLAANALRRHSAGSAFERNECCGSLFPQVNRRFGPGEPPGCADFSISHVQMEAVFCAHAPIAALSTVRIHFAPAERCYGV